MTAADGDVDINAAYTAFRLQREQLAAAVADWERGVLLCVLCAHFFFLFFRGWRRNNKDDDETPKKKSEI